MAKHMKKDNPFKIDTASIVEGVISATISGLIVLLVERLI